MSDATVNPVQLNAAAPVEDRRQSPRSKMTKIVYMNMEAENGGILLDISLSGLSFQLAGPLAVENQISFRFLAEGIEDVEILADVAWLDEHRKRGGLRFGKLPEEVGDRIPIWFRQTPPRITCAGHRLPSAAAKPFSLTQISKAAPSRPSVRTEMIPYSLSRQQSQPDLPRIGDRESGLGGLANPLRSARNLRQSGSAQKLQFPAKRERRLGTIAVSVFVAMIVIAGAFVFADKHEAGELLIHLGERVSGDHSLQSAGVMSAPTPGTPSFTSPDSSDSTGDAIRAASAQSASNSNAADPAIAIRSVGDEDRPEERSNSGLNDNETTVPPTTDQTSRSVTSSFPSPSESSTTVGQLRRGGSSKSQREDGGHTELVLAQRYLRGANASKDRDMATHLLWVAVGEGNPQAELDLADLYLRSDGAPAKNCAQARILLNDSSNSGNLEATQQLAKLSDYGCR